MVRRSMAAILVVLIALGGQVQGQTLDDLIPREKWKTCGIEKLTDPERAELRIEIIELLQRYHASLRDGLAVIAPSLSTSMKAREILAQLGKTEVPLRDAEAILVIVRSSWSNPLQSWYESVGELRRHAEGQRNLFGPEYHVYIYSMDDDLHVTKVSHNSFKAD